MKRRERLPGFISPAILLLAAALFVSLPFVAGAEPVGVDIGVVLASNEGTAIDPALANIKAKLYSMFNYSSYKMLDRQKRTLNVGETGEFGLPGNRFLRVSPVPATGNKVRLSVQMNEGSRNLLTTTLGLNRGGMVLVGGPSWQKGVMILLISAE